MSTRWRTTEYNGRTRWEYISTILSIEPAAIDLANVLTDIPGGGVGAEGVGGASLGIAGYVGTVSDGRCRLKIEGWLVYFWLVVWPLWLWLWVWQTLTRMRGEPI